MPVMPAFSAYAPMPNLAQWYLGGARIAQEGQIAIARIGLEKQKLAQDAVQAEMTLAARESVATRQMLLEQQQNEIAKAYKDASLGMKSRELDQAEQQISMKVESAARQYAARQKYQARMNELVTGGAEPSAAAQQAMLEVGADAGFPSGAYTASMRGQRSPFDFGGAKPIAGLPDNYRQLQTGPASRAYIKLPPEADSEVSQPMPGYMEYKGKVFPERADPRVTESKKALADFKKSNGSMMPYITGEKPTPKSSREVIGRLKPEYERLKKEAEYKRATPSSTNKIGRFTIIRD